MDHKSLVNGRNIYKKVLKNIKYDLKQNIINCGFVPSLQYIAISKLAISLWQHNLHNFTEQDFISNQYNKKGIYFTLLLEIYESNSLTNVSSLILPLHCQEELKQMFRNVTMEIIDFLFEHTHDSFPKEIFSWDDVEIFLMYCSNICWTQEFYINIRKSRNNIIENSNLDTIDKYILACNGCTKDKIQNLFKKLPGNLINELIKNDKEFEHFKKYILVAFWTYYFREETEKFSELINGRETFEFILVWSIIHYKGLAWHFFWENFADEEMKIRTINLRRADKYVFLYLLTKRNHSELEMLGAENVHNNFADMLNRISKSCKVVLVPYYVLDVFKTNDICYSFKLIIHCRNNHHFNTIEYIKIWEEFIIQFKNDFKNSFNKMYDGLYNIFNIKYDDQLLYSFLNKDWQTAKFLLNMDTYQEIKDYLSGHRGFILCKEIICKSPDLFEKIVKLLLIYEEEISNFKKCFFCDSRFDDILYELIVHDKYEILKEILFIFCSTDEISRYKFELPFKDNANIILNIIKNVYVTQTTYLLNKFLSWCFEENDAQVIRCKSIIFDFEAQRYFRHNNEFFRRLKILINLNNWNDVEIIWRWIFFVDKNKIKTPEKKLKRIKKILYYTSSNEYCLLITRFIMSCFEKDEIDELKEQLQKSFIFKIVRDLINIDHHEEVNNLFDWLFSFDKKKIDKFKDLFMSVMGCKLFFKLVIYRIDIVKVKALFEWFKPSIQSANIFNKHFINYIKNKKKLHLQHLKRCGKLTKKNFKLWDILNKRANKGLKLLSNYIE